MKKTVLQFDSLAELAAFWKQVNDRGYLILVKDLTLRCALSDDELKTALERYGARKLLPGGASGND